MEYLKQFQNHISRNDLPAIVSLWQEYCLSDEINPEEAIQILQDIQRSPLNHPFGCYVEEILPIWETLPPSENKHTIFKIVFDMETKNDKNLADIGLKYLEERYPNDADFAQKIKLVGLRDKISFQQAISNFELLSHMKVGNFFLHTGGWGVGEVIDVSMLREQITLEFDFVAGHKELSFKNAFKTLLPISKEHFLARRFGAPEEFEAFAKKDPVETIRLLLKDLGPKTAQEIKDELCDLVIPEPEWARWWQTARTKLKKDTLIESPKNLKGVFRLRIAEMTHEDRLQNALANPLTIDAMIEQIYSFLRDFPQALKNEGFKKNLVEKIRETLSRRELTDSQEMQLLLLLKEIHHEGGNNLADLIKGLSNLVVVVNQIEVVALKKRILQEIKTLRPDWPEIYASLLSIVQQNNLKDFILDSLMEAKKSDLVKGVAKGYLEDPVASPSSLVWYFQKILSSSEYPYSDREGKNLFFEAFFVLMHKLEMHPPSREFVKKMYAMLTNNRYELVRTMFKDADISVVKEILLLSTKCHSLLDHDLKILQSLAAVVHPSLQQLGHGIDAEEEPIWTTQEGYNRVKARIEQIATVETVENAKEIEVARSHGDLRENSEFKFAQEKRARLQSELKFLSDQLKQMRILTKNDIQTDKVSVGSVVHLKNQKGQTISYSLLGPWDADPDHNILSFQSKLAKELLGLEKGSQVMIQNELWTIEEITSFL